LRPLPPSPTGEGPGDGCFAWKKVRKWST